MIFFFFAYSPKCFGLLVTFYRTIFFFARFLTVFQLPIFPSTLFSIFLPLTCGVLDREKKIFFLVLIETRGIIVLKYKELLLKVKLTIFELLRR